MVDRILYMTDKMGVTQGYAPVFNRILMAARIPQHAVIKTDVYNIVPDALKKKGNQKEWILNPEERWNVQNAFDLKISTTNPKVIVVSCGAVLGVLTDEDRYANTISKTRGGVYHYRGIPVIVAYPISATNRITTAKGDENDVYNVRSGAWVVLQDWQKVSRYFNDKVRRVPKFRYSITRTLADVEAAERFLHDCSIIATDIETVSTHVDSNDPSSYRTESTCVGYSGLHKSGRIRSFVFPFYDKFKPLGVFWPDADDHKLAWESVVRINGNSAVKVLQNGTYDSSYMIRDRAPYNNYMLDTIHMWHSLYPELPKTLDFISSILLDDYQYWKADIKGIDEKDETQADNSMERYWRYNAMDCHSTLFDCLFMLPAFSAQESLRTNYQAEFMASMSGLRMGLKGIKADKERLAEIRVKLQKQTDEATKRIRYLLDDPDFNPQSPAQVNQLFYDVLGAPERDAKGKLKGPSSKTSRSTGTIPMKLIRTEHPMFKFFSDAVYDAKRPKKQISNICDMGAKLQTSRFRYKLNAAGTDTWRYASKSSDFWDGTNAQNITKKMRDWLVADEHFIMWDIDYSQSDGWFVAHESNDDKMINVMLSGKDTHAVHAAHFFKDSYENVVAGKEADDPAYVDPLTGTRQLAKRIVHGANFQMAAFTLFVTMGKEAVIAAAYALGHKNAHTWNDEQLVQLCNRLLNEYRRLYPRLSKHEWYGEINRILAEKGSITNWYGMTRKFMGAATDPRTQREATAFYGQSGTAMNMNRVIYEIDYGFIPKRFRDGPNPHADKTPMRLNGNNGLFLLLQVHDSFVGISDTRVPGWQEQINNLLTVLERPITINGHEFYVPAEADVMARWSSGAIKWNRDNPPTLEQIHAA